MTWADGRLLAVDLETTAADPMTALPVSFALADIDFGQVSKVRYGLINPGVPIPEAATAIHHITDADVAARGGTLEATVLGLVSRFMHAQADGIPIVGMNVRYDLTVIDSCYRHLTGHGLREDGWDGPVIDALVLDRHVDRYRKGSRKLTALCAHYGVRLADAHAAHADAVAAAMVCRAIAARYPEVGNAELDELQVMQKAWHRAWFVSYQEYRVSHNQEPMPESEASWPLPEKVAVQ